MRLHRLFLTLSVTVLGIIGIRLRAQDSSAEAWQMETKGQAGEARQHLQRGSVAASGLNDTLC